MKKPITIEDLRNSAVAKINPHLFEKAPAKSKGSKFSNEKTEAEGEFFHSKKEAKRYKELRKMLKAGEIGFLAKQVQYELNTGGSHSLIYIADFQYVDRSTGKTILEDVKGMRTAVYKKKKKLMLKIHNIEITEI